MNDAGVSIDKLPPQNIEAEQSVLGAIIFDNDALLKALELLAADDFYRESHRRIYNSMLELFNKSDPIDIITLTDYLRKTNELDAIGGIAYLSTLANSIPTSANIRYHAKIIREKALLRALIQTSTHINTKVYEDDLEADAMVDYAENAIFQIADKRARVSFFSMKDVVKDAFKMIEHLYDKKETITGVPTGFKDLDDLTAGFQPGEPIIIGGRPGMGKQHSRLILHSMWESK